MFSMNEPDLGWWEKEEPEAQEVIELPARKPVLYQTGRLFDVKEIA